MKYRISWNTPDGEKRDALKEAKWREIIAFPDTLRKERNAQADAMRQYANWPPHLTVHTMHFGPQKTLAERLGWPF